jgi:ribokinase
MTAAPDPWIVAFGSINADHQMRVPTAPCGGTVAATDLVRLSGGKANNVAVGAARLGHTVVLLGTVGDDDLASIALEGPRAAGLDLGGIRVVSGSTGLSTILVEPDGAKSIVLALNVNDEPDERPELTTTMRDAPPGSVLVVDLEVHPLAASTAAEAARDAGLTVVVDPAPADRVTERLLGLADHVVPDHLEAADLVGRPVDDPEAALVAARELRRRGAGSAHVKLPEGGCATSGPDGDWLTLPPDPLEVVDTTGAGDAFACGLAAALAEDRSSREVTRRAVAASACAVGEYGSQPGYPTPQGLQAMAARTRIVERR